MEHRERGFMFPQKQRGCQDGTTAIKSTVHCKRDHYDREINVRYPGFLQPISRLTFMKVFNDRTAFSERRKHRSINDNSAIIATEPIIGRLPISSHEADFSGIVSFRVCSTVFLDISRKLRRIAGEMAGSRAWRTENRWNCKRVPIVRLPTPFQLELETIFQVWIALIALNYASRGISVLCHREWIKSCWQIINKILFFSKNTQKFPNFPNCFF